ncbi:MAG: hypothetical protein Q7U54_06705 [Bacteroidales bacterium]|nr:hypothetical protein [Bacteroidales bacterium]
MKRFITYLMRVVLIGEISKGTKNKDGYLLPIILLFLLTSAILGSINFYAVRLMHVDPAFLRKNVVPFGLFFMFAIPICSVLFYRRKINLDEIREEVSKLDFKELKRERFKGVIISLLCGFSLLIAVAIMLITEKLGII